MVEAPDFRGCGKTRFLSNSPQNRHPERSASRVYRVTQRLLARSRRTSTVLISPMPLGAFNHRSPLQARHTVFP